MTNDASLTLDRNADGAVYEQIARQIRDRIAAGELAAGQALPSVRVLASDLGVNLNTVARAYRLLEEEGFVIIRERSGAEVVAPPARAEEALQERLERELRDVLRRMHQAGISGGEIRRLVDSEVAGPDGRPQ